MPKSQLNNLNLDIPRREKDKGNLDAFKWLLVNKLSQPANYPGIIDFLEKLTDPKELMECLKVFYCYYNEKTNHVSVGGGYTEFGTFDQGQRIAKLTAKALFHAKEKNVGKGAALLLSDHSKKFHPTLSEQINVALLNIQADPVQADQKAIQSAKIVKENQNEPATQDFAEKIEVKTPEERIATSKAHISEAGASSEAVKQPASVARAQAAPEAAGRSARMSETPPAGSVGRPHVVPEAAGRTVSGLNAPASVSRTTPDTVTGVAAPAASSIQASIAPAEKAATPVSHIPVQKEALSSAEAIHSVEKKPVPVISSTPIIKEQAVSDKNFNSVNKTLNTSELKPQNDLKTIQASAHKETVTKLSASDTPKRSIAPHPVTKNSPVSKPVAPSGNLRAELKNFILLVTRYGQGPERNTKRYQEVERLMQHLDDFNKGHLTPTAFLVVLHSFQSEFKGWLNTARNEVGCTYNDNFIQKEITRLIKVASATASKDQSIYHAQSPHLPEKAIAIDDLLSPLIRLLNMRRAGDALTTQFGFRTMTADNFTKVLETRINVFKEGIQDKTLDDQGKCKVTALLDTINDELKQIEKFCGKGSCSIFASKAVLVERIHALQSTIQTLQNQLNVKGEEAHWTPVIPRAA